MKNQTNNFSARLKKFRIEAGLSQGDLAKMIDMSRSSIANWEQGTCEPGIEGLKRIAAALSISVDTLVGSPDALGERELALLKKFHSLNSDGQSHIESCLTVAMTSSLFIE